MSFLTPTKTTSRPSAERKSETLFTTNSIEEIRKIEQKTRSEIEQKKQELRHLISEHYRDLIDSAESIHQIQKATRNLNAKLYKIKNVCINVTPYTRSQNSFLTHLSEGADVSLRRRAFEIGRKIKNLVDTPEKIWSSIETNDHLRAVTSYLQAKQIYHELKNDNDSNTIRILSTIPLFERQWQIISDFPKRILRSCRRRLQMDNLSELEYASALCAIIPLENRTPMQVFIEFLSLRKNALSTLLNEFVARTYSYSKETSNASIAECISNTLCQFCKMLQVTLYLIGYIFLSNQRIHALSLSKSGQIISSSKSVSSMQGKRSLHSSLPVNKNSFNNEGEIFVQSSDKPLLHRLLDSIARIVEGYQLEYSFVPIESLQNLTYEWIKNCTKFIKLDLLSAVRTAAELTAIEMQLRKQILNPFGELVNSSLREHSLTWNEICMMTTNREIDMWSTFFQEVFNEQLKRIIIHSFERVSLKEQLDKCLSDDNTVGSSRMLSFLKEEDNLGQFMWQVTTEYTGVELIKRKAAGITSITAEIITYLEQHLSNIMADLTLFFHKQTTKEFLSSVESDDEKKKELIRDACYQKMYAIIKEIDENIDQIRHRYFSSDAQDRMASNNNEKRTLVMRSILLGRTCRSIALHSRILKQILTDVESLVDPVNNNVFFSRSFSFDTFILPKTSEKYNVFTKLALKSYLKSHYIWVDWISHHFIPHFIATKKENTTYCEQTSELPTLFQALETPPSILKKNWLEVKIKNETGDGEMEQYVPCIPTPSVFALLFALTEEINKIGGHTIDQSVLLYLKREVANTLYDLIKLTLTQRERTLSKENAIQFWFDIRFIFDILSGRTIVTPQMKEILIEMKEHQTKAKEQNHIQTAINTQTSTDSDNIDQNINKNDQSSETKSVNMKNENDTKEKENTDLDTEDEEVEEMIEWKKRIDVLLNKIKSNMDPIDIRFYEPHLKTNIRSYYQKCSQLFGVLTRFNTFFEDSQERTFSDNKASVLYLIPPIARFSLLPITVNTPELMQSLNKSTLFSPSSSPSPPTIAAKPSLSSLASPITTVITTTTAAANVFRNVSQKAANNSTSLMQSQTSVDNSSTNTLSLSSKLGVSLLEKFSENLSLPLQPNALLEDKSQLKKKTTSWF